MPSAQSEGEITLSEKNCLDFLSKNIYDLSISRMVEVLDTDINTDTRIQIAIEIQIKKQLTNTDTSTEKIFLPVNQLNGGHAGQRKAESFLRPLGSSVKMKSIKTTCHLL